MSCCQCKGIEQQFDDKVARKERKQYRKRGPRKSTRLLLEAVQKADGASESLLDIGGGIGVIQHTLLANGVKTGINVDASPAYLHTAQEEARDQGYEDRMQYIKGDFIEVAAGLPECDIVTLDRVICCYPDMQQLVGLSSGKARKLYAVVYPRENWAMRPMFKLLNFLSRLRGSHFRAFLHPTSTIDALIRNNGFTPLFQQNTMLWQVWVYGR